MLTYLFVALLMVSVLICKPAEKESLVEHTDIYLDDSEIDYNNGMTRRPEAHVDHYDDTVEEVEIHHPIVSLVDSSPEVADYSTPVA